MGHKFKSRGRVLEKALVGITEAVMWLERRKTECKGECNQTTISTYKKNSNKINF